MAAYDIPCVVTAVISHPLDLISKLRKAKEMRGTKYIQMLSPCPPGWRFSTEKTVEIGRLAVRTGMWALFEIEHGELKLSRPSAALVDKAKRKPVEEYLQMQGRFGHLTKEDVTVTQKWIDQTWEKYKRL